jgi:hypothetical protein
VSEAMVDAASVTEEFDKKLVASAKRAKTRLDQERTSLQGRIIRTRADYYGEALCQYNQNLWHHFL